METHLIRVVSKAFEFIYVLLPVVSLTVLAYRLASLTGKRTGSSLLFFSAVFYLAGVYKAFYITTEFGIITSAELIFIQLIYLIAGFLLIFGSISFYKFFIRLTSIGSLKETLQKVTLIILFYLLSFIPYFLVQSYEKMLHIFTDVFYILIQAQFFIAYFVLGDIMYTNKDICEKARNRSKLIKLVSFYYLFESILWLWILNTNISPLTLDRIFLSTEVIRASVGDF